MKYLQASRDGRVFVFNHVQADINCGSLGQTAKLLHQAVLINEESLTFYVDIWIKALHVFFYDCLDGRNFYLPKIIRLFHAQQIIKCGETSFKIMDVVFGGLSTPFAFLT